MIQPVLVNSLKHGPVLKIQTEKNRQCIATVKLNMFNSVRTYLTERYNSRFSIHMKNCTYCTRKTLYIQLQTYLYLFRFYRARLNMKIYGNFNGTDQLSRYNVRIYRLNTTNSLLHGFQWENGQIQARFSHIWNSHSKKTLPSIESRRLTHHMTKIWIWLNLRKFLF